MSRCPRESLRPLTEHERQALQKIERSGSERADVVARAREMLAVVSGASRRACRLKDGGHSVQ